MPVTHLHRKTAALVLFAAISLGMFSIFYFKAGGTTPFSATSYQVSFGVADAAGLVANADVRAAGVDVGRVESVTASRLGGATVKLALDSAIAPLAENAHVRIRLKTPLGEAYVAITPGDGAAGTVPNGGTLPTGDTVGQVQLDQILSVFNPATRRRLRGDLADLSTGLAGRGSDLNATLAGSAPTFEQGEVALGVLARQRNELAGVVANTSSLLGTLAERQASLRQLVSQVDSTAQAAASRDASIAQTVKALPTTLTQVKTVAGDLVPFGNIATPVLANLATGATALTPTLSQLTPASEAGVALLRELPSLVKRANPLLDRLTTFSGVAPALTTALPTLLCQLNPMLTYLDRYRREIGAFVGNVGMANDAPDNLGRNPIAVFPTVDTNSVRFDNSLLTNSTETILKALGVPYEPMQYNPYPKPGTVGDPQPFDGQVPTVPSACAS